MQRFLEDLEPFPHRWERNAQSVVFALIPGRADAELAATAGEHVKGGDRLGEQSWIAVGHPGHEQPEPDRLSVRGEEAEGRVPLRHWFRRRRQRVHLEPVIHHADVGQAGGFRRITDRRERRPYVVTAVSSSSGSTLRTHCRVG